MKKRIISFVMAICLLVAMVPSMGVRASEEISEYEERFGITLEQLFTQYPHYLSPDAESYIINSLIDGYTRAIDGHQNENPFIQYAIEILSETQWMEFTLEQSLEGFAFYEEEQEALLWETVLMLMNNIYNNKDVITTMTQKLGDGLNAADTVLDLSTEVGKNKLVEIIKETVDCIPKKQVDEITDFLFKKADFIAEAVGATSELVEVSQVIQTMCFLYGIQRNSLYLLRDSVPPNSSFVDAIEMVLDNMDKNPGVYIYENYGNKAAIRLICKLIELIPQAKPIVETVNQINAIFNIVTSIIRDDLLKYATMSEMIQSITLTGYVNCLYSAVLDQRTKFTKAAIDKKTIGADDIANYEFIYAAYVAAIKTALEAALPLAKDELQEGNLQKAISLCEQLTFDKYIMMCLRELRADIDANVVAPPSSLHGDPNACIVATYPASGTLTVTKENANIMDRPCSVNTDVNAQLIESGALNAKYTVTGSCVNTANNTWYIITTKSGQTGYIYSGNCTYAGASDATITGLDMPTTLSVGSRYWIKGTISANSSTILSVSCYVYDAAGNPVTGGKADVNGKTYVLDNSAIDTATEFNILGAGTYTWKITANVDVGNACQEVVLGSGALVISNHTSDMSGSSGDQAKYNQLLLNVNWSLIDQVGRQTPYSYSCSCFALAYARTLLDNTVHYFYEYNQYGNTEYHVNAVWDWGAYASVWPATTNEALQKLYTELCMGKPVIVYVTGRGSEGHYVTVIGFENVTSLDKLSESNFLIIDPVYKDGHIAVNLGGVGYSLKSGGSVYQVVVDVSGANVPFSATPNVSCPHNYNTDEKAATCTTDGIRTKTCTLCNDTITETIPALGHDYQEKLVEATCGSYGYTHRTCSRCDFSETTVPSEEDWSGWLEEKPAAMAEKLIESRLQYRFREKAVESGTVEYVPAWPAGFDTSHGLYAKYNNTPVSDSETDSHRTTVTSNQTIGYLYYHWCRGTVTNGPINRRVNSVYTGEYRAFHAFYSTEGAGEFDANGNYGEGTYYYPNGGCCADTYWYYQIPVNQQTFITEDKNAENGWGNWSDWSFEEVVETDIREVNERTVYRYYVGPLPEHSWDNGAITKEPTENTEGEKAFTCTVCGATKKEAIPAKGGTEPSTPSCTNGHGYEERITQKPTKTSSGTLSYICIDCGYVETVELPPLTEDSKYQKEVIAPSCMEKGYTIYRWSPVVYIESDFTDATGHTWNGGVVTKEPTASSEGVKTYTCTVCSEVKTESIPRKDHIHNFVNGTCLLCGAVDPNWDYTDLITPIAYRKAGANRFDTAFLVADTMKAQLGVAKFDAVIVASGVSFADALSGSYLAAVKNAPILLSFNDKYNNMAKDYIRENLTPGGTVYILGGTSAVPASMETGLDGFKVKRLAGKDRFGTNLEILKEAGVEDKPILVCTGLSFADSLSASAAEMPILLVWNKLTKDQKTFLENAGDEFYIIGGESAVSCQMEEQLRDYGYVERIGGKNRFETSVRIAEEFFDNPDAVVLAYAWNFPDGLCGGALAAAMDAPLILTMDKYESQAAKYVFGKTLPRRFVLGSGELISDDAIRTIFGPATDIR